jgi:Outer membrane lipoprotein-sorting protein
MLERDAQRQAQLRGYTAIRHYSAVNGQHKAEMTVKVVCADDGAKQFSILSEDGSHAIRRFVFYKMLKEEADGSRRENRNATSITPANYEFQLTGSDVVDGRPTYVLQLTPKGKNKYLVEGKIWVDAADYSIVQIEGRPAHNLSFWTRSVHFVYKYQKVGPFWLASRSHSVNDIRFFGPSELTIENSDYRLNTTGSPQGIDTSHQPVATFPLNGRNGPPPPRAKAPMLD